MSTIKRRSRQRLNTPESLVDLWDRQQPPPAWAHAPGEHHEELVELVLFGSAENWRSIDHPHYAEWTQAMSASKADTIACRTSTPPTR